jgi:hypothetical protein
MFGCNEWLLKGMNSEVKENKTVGIIVSSIR